jgi:hypothetical protein
LSIKPGKIWPEESTSDRNRKGDYVTGSVDKNKSIFGFEIDRKGSSGSVNGECWYLIFYFWLLYFKALMQDFTKNFQFEANAGISGGQIDRKSQFLFGFVKWLNIDQILGDVLMPFYSNSFYYGGEKFF